MFERYTWVCSTFEVLRRPSARRHNDNLHFAQSGIFRPAEYLIARSNGNIPPTINPFLLRSNNKDARKTNNNPLLLHILMRTIIKIMMINSALKKCLLEIIQNLELH
jgi:hypothetical protein